MASALFTMNSFGAAEGSALTGAEAIQLTLGRDFVVAMNTAAGEDENSSRGAVAELAFLIDRLEGQPEAAELQQVMRSVIRGNTTGVAARSRIQAIMTAFSKRSTGSGKWYFDTGCAVANLVYDSFNNDTGAARKGAAAVFELTRSAPPEISDDLSRQLSAIAAHRNTVDLGQDSLSEIVRIGVQLFRSSTN